MNDILEPVDKGDKNDAKQPNGKRAAEGPLVGFSTQVGCFYLESMIISTICEGWTSWFYLFQESTKQI